MPQPKKFAKLPKMRVLTLILTGLLLSLALFGHHLAPPVSAQAPDGTLAVEIINDPDPIVLRIDGELQGSGPDGTGPVADKIEILIHQPDNTCLAVTGPLVVSARTYEPATDPAASQSVIIATLPPQPGLPAYFVDWYPDSSMPSGLYEIIVEGECTGVSEERIQLFDRRAYALTNGGHFQQIHIYYGEMERYQFDAVIQGKAA